MAEPLSARDLAAFVAAVEASSIEGASATLMLTQSAVSKRVLSLERRVGATLLERSRHGVRRTPAGRLLYPQARKALDALARAEACVTGERADDQRELRVAASLTVGEYLLPSWLAGFRADVPEALLHVDADIANSPSVLTALRERIIDIGFVEGLDRLTDLQRLPVGRDELVVVVAAGHPWSRRRDVHPSALLTEPYLTRERDSGTRAVATTALARVGVELSPDLETPSTQALKHAVLGGGFTLLSNLTVQGEIIGGTLRALPVRGVPLTRTLHAVRRSVSAECRAASLLWHWLREKAATGGDG